MNKAELVSVLQPLIRAELKELLKSKDGRALVKELISKEVRAEVDHLLTEMEQPSTRQPIAESAPKNTKLTRMVERGELPPSVQEPVTFVKNQKLNSMLNQTLNEIRNGHASLPSSQGGAAQASLLREQYAGQSYGMTPMPSPESSGKPLAAMIPNVDVNGNPMMINPNALPDHVASALTRDYRKLMKKVDGKRG